MEIVFGLFVGLFISGIICGLLSWSLAGYKGYNGYFAVGFFFSVIGSVCPSQQAN